MHACPVALPLLQALGFAHKANGHVLLAKSGEGPNKWRNIPFPKTTFFCPSYHPKVDFLTACSSSPVLCLNPYLNNSTIQLRKVRNRRRESIWVMEILQGRRLFSCKGERRERERESVCIPSLINV